MGFIHFLTNFFVIAFFQSNAYFKNAILFADHIFSTQCILFTDFWTNFVKHVISCITQRVNFRMMFLDCSNNIFAALSSVVVC